jgi:hypothetical protein
MEAISSSNGIHGVIFQMIEFFNIDLIVTEGFSGFVQFLQAYAGMP